MSRLKNFQKLIEAPYLIQTPHNLSYLTGYQEEEGFLLIKKESVFFLTDSRYVEGASLKNPEIEVVDYGGRFTETLCDYLEGEEDLYFEEAVPYSFFKRLEESLEVEGIFLQPGKNLVEEMRLYKDEEELNLIRRSASITDEMFQDVVSVVRPEMSELDLKNEMEYALRKRGASMASFDLIVASGNRSSLPHGVATEKKIVYNEPILFDIGVSYDGYASDMTRMIYLGDPDPLFLKIYDIVYRAQQIGLETARKGVLGSDVDKAVRAYITEAGYGECFGHSTGHGVGLDIHENPNISYRSETVLDEGMVFTIEPGIYLEGQFGVRIEDLVALTEKGLEVFSKTKKELIIL